jgi:hypothetical protein
MFAHYFLFAGRLFAAHVAFWLFVELLFALGTAEVISLVLMATLGLRGSRIDVHLTHGIGFGSHRTSPFYFDFTSRLKRRLMARAAQAARAFRA